MRSFAAALALLFAGVQAGSGRGSCSDNPISGVAEFDQDRFAGRWYKISMDSDFFDEDQNCSAEDWVVNFNGTLTVGKNSYTLANGWEQKPMRAIQSSNNKGEYIVFDEEEQPDRDANTDVYIVATDYENWAIEYVCVDIVPGKLYFDSTSILGRAPQLTDTDSDLIKILLDNRLDQYNQKKLTDVVQCRICPFAGIPELLSE